MFLNSRSPYPPLEYARTPVGNWIAVLCLLPLQDDLLVPGLLATYSDGRHTITSVAPTPNFYLEPDESLHPSLGTEFDVQWIGFITVLRTEEYSFDGGQAEIFIRGQKILSQPVKLESGQHPIRITYHRSPGVAFLQLRWASRHFVSEPVPSSVFSHYPTEAEKAQAMVETGRTLVEEFGCTNCHFSESLFLEGRSGPDLTHIGSRISANWLHAWLANPRHFHEGAVMPGMLDWEGRLHVTAYLAGLRAPLEIEAPVPVTTHDISRGKELYETLGCLACHDLPSLSLSGMGSKRTLFSLKTYLKDPTEYDSSGRMPSLFLTDDEAHQLAAFLVQSRNTEFEQTIPEGSAGDPARGKALVQTSGCIACHALYDSQPLLDELRSPPVVELSLGQGCLLPEPPSHLPRYDFTDSERKAITEFLQSRKVAPDVSRAPIHTLRRRVHQLRCTACHHLDGLGPKVSLPERVPPLTDVGTKLRTDWLRKVLLEGVRVRGELRTRMPHYPSEQVDAFVENFAKTSGLSPVEDITMQTLGEQEQEAGVDLIGNNGAKGGLGCTACHDVGEFRATAGEKGPQMLSMTERLRFDWFHRWMVQPARIVSGTSMPTFFTQMPQTRIDSAIAHLWAALSLGYEMPKPDGVADGRVVFSSEVIPMPSHETILIRTMMPDASPAAIAVGMPGRGITAGISYCFDATYCRLLYAWQGGFLDLTPTHGKFMGHPVLLGTVFYRSRSLPFRLTQEDSVPSVRFLGYRLVEGFPEFHYRINDMGVHERIVPTDSGNGFVRQFLIESIHEPVWFIEDSDPGIDVTSTYGSPVNGAIRILNDTQARFEVTVTRRENTSQ